MTSGFDPVSKFGKFPGILHYRYHYFFSLPIFPVPVPVLFSVPNFSGTGFRIDQKWGKFPGLECHILKHANLEKQEMEGWVGGWVGRGRGEVRLVVYWVSSSIRQHSMTNGVFLR